MTEFLEIRRRAGVDEDGRLLSEVWNAQGRCDRWAGRRHFSAVVIILLSIPMAVLLASEVIGARARHGRLLLLCWAAALIHFLVCTVAEQRSRRRVAQALADAGGRRVTTEEDG